MDTNNHNNSLIRTKPLHVNISFFSSELIYLDCLFRESARKKKEKTDTNPDSVADSKRTMKSRAQRNEQRGNVKAWRKLNVC